MKRNHKVSGTLFLEENKLSPLASRGEQLLNTTHHLVVFCCIFYAMNICFKLSCMSLQPCVGLCPPCGSLLVSITSKVWCPSASPCMPAGWELPSVCWEAAWSPAAVSKALPRTPTTIVSTTPNRDPTPFRHPPIMPKVHTFELAVQHTPEDWKDHMWPTAPSRSLFPLKGLVTMGLYWMITWWQGVSFLDID